MLIYELTKDILPPGRESYLIVKNDHGWFCDSTVEIIRCQRYSENLWKLDNNYAYEEIADKLPTPYPSLEAFIDAKPELFI